MGEGLRRIKSGIIVLLRQPLNISGFINQINMFILGLISELLKDYTSSQK
jgi:hypothetical protein